MLQLASTGAGRHALAFFAAFLLASEPTRALASDDPGAGSRPDVGSWRFAGFPVVTYGSDLGLQLGAALFLYRRLPEQPEADDRLTLSLSLATRGPRTIDLGTTMRRLFSTSLRLDANLHLADDRLMPYWGEGAGLGGLSTPPGAGSPPPPYRYHDRRMFTSVALRGVLISPVGWHVRARWLDVDVRKQSALLAAADPPGARGGRVALGEVGLLVDTRDQEVETRRGVFATASAFQAPRLGGVSDFAFHGYDAALRVYVPLWPGGTLQARALYDLKVAGALAESPGTAAVPFFERMLYEGLRFGEGLGGAGTLRGVARFRLAGDEKALVNVEVRERLAATHLLGRREEWEVAAGFDAGRARQAGYAPVHAQGVAIGARMIWDRSVVVRLDVARALGGADYAAYLAFGKLF